MDGQCNEMFPPQPKVASETSPLVTVAEQKVKNKAVKEKVMLKVAEKVAAEEAEQQKFLEAQKKAAEDEAWAKAVEEARHNPWVLGHKGSRVPGSLGPDHATRNGPPVTESPVRPARPRVL